MIGRSAVVVALMIALLVWSPPAVNAQAPQDWNPLGDALFGSESGDYLGQSIAMTADGSRFAASAPGPFGEPGKVQVFDWTGTAWDQVGDDIVGQSWSVALSADGSRVAIGGPDAFDQAGVTRVYDWNGSAWLQVGDDIVGEAANDNAGRSVALSADGSILAVGAPRNIAQFNGYVRVFAWNGSAWDQLGADIDRSSGWSIDMSADGSRVAIGSLFEHRVRVFDWDGASWTQVGADLSTEQERDNLAYRVAMSADGTRITTGRADEAGSGYLQVFELVDSSWTQVGGNIGEGQDSIGAGIALSADGTRIAGGLIEDEGVQVFDWNGTTWIQVGSDLSVSAEPDIMLGLAISADGSRVAAGWIPDNQLGAVQVFELQEANATGDANCDGAADLGDALTIAQFAVGLRTDAGACPLADSTTQINAAAGDVDGDGVTDLGDALVVVRCAVGLRHDGCP